MPQQVASSVENNFTKGLVTEYTGLNFPENACTDVDNCTFTLVGDVTRRRGIDFEVNSVLESIDRTGKAINRYVWKNVGGDGDLQLVVTQVGSILYFWSITASTVANPLTNQLLVSTVDISVSTVIGGSFDATVACEFTDGNGYLFVFHPSIEPTYCTYVSGAITATQISVEIRDFTGVVDGLGVSTRPNDLSDAHLYNISNQGWVKGTLWSATSTDTETASVGIKTFTVQAGLTVSLGDRVTFSNSFATTPGGIYQPAGSFIMSGEVTGYTGTDLTVNITAVSYIWSGSSYNGSINPWVITPTSVGYVDEFKTDTGTYPSNADVWWRFRNSSNVFDPATTVANTVLSLGPAPKGRFVINAFNQQRDLASGVDGITDVVTTVRPTNGTWFQGRIWYTGVDASQSASGTALYTTWTENIYFSQVVLKEDDFGKCYQTNDPSSEQLFDILPTDGGVIVIQGCGPIYKLFPIQNGLLVFAANGVWFITGSQGIGFAATDYTITKLSAVQGLSRTSFVDVQGLPYFWNEDGIYAVQPQQGGGLSVETMTYQTIDTYYADIPLNSKRYARGDYDPINYTIQWIYKSEEETSVTDRYSFDKILSYSTANKAFYPYTVDTETAAINSICYINAPGGVDGIVPCFKYLSSAGSSLGFADEHDTDYVDWDSIDPVNYVSYFITGYKVHGQAIKKFQLQYLQMYARTNDEASSYKIQGLWDYANSGDSGRWTTIQQINTNATFHDVVFRRIKIRGNGYALQIKVISTDGSPFDIIGWAAVDTINAGT